MSGYLVSPQTKALIEQLIDEKLNKIDEKRSPRGRREVKRSNMTISQAQCTVEIPAATDELTQPGVGKARLLLRDGDDLQAYSPDRVVDVINHSDSASFEVDQYLKVELIDNQWQPYYPSGGGGGTPVIRGTIVGVNCVDGTVEIDPVRSNPCPPAPLDYGDNIIAYDPFEILTAVPDAETALVGAMALAVYLYDVENCGDGRWELTLINGINECDVVVT